ncbi:pilus assembly FimT family protein [Ornithinibacillus xuwenensis]|uniref:Type II secretion system protein n=1 Tax=Ornithinibacillus xuwenensis TaxID=3144668 RepID=A0ABU9XBC0_9BACI
MKRVKRNGFTLIELLATIAILTMVITVFIPIFSQIVNWTNQADDELVASNLLGQVAYDIKNDSTFFTELTSTTCGNGQPDSIEYDTYFVNDMAYKVNLQICKEEQVNLYRTNIQIYTDKMVSESFTYVPIGGQS